MLKRFQSRFLVNLGELEGDYRVFHLRDDVAQSILYISVAILGVLGMIVIDDLLYKSRPDFLMGLMIYRIAYILISLLVIAVIRKTNKVRVYDRLIMAWIFMTILSLLLFNFIR